MVVIVLHNRMNYLETLERLCHRYGITHSVIVEKEEIGKKLIGNFELLISSKGVLQPVYDKALILMMDDSQEKLFMETIRQDPCLINLTLDDEGFVCSIPVSQIKLINLKQTRLLPVTHYPLLSYINPARIIWDLQASTKEEAINELAHTFNSEVNDLPLFTKQVIERETLSSTGFGNGIAIPHARSNLLNDIVLAIGRSKNGIDFISADNKKVTYVFLVGTPNDEDHIDRYLQLMAGLSSFLRGFKEDLFKVASLQELLELFRENENFSK